MRSFAERLFLALWIVVSLLALIVGGAFAMERSNAALGACVGTALVLGIPLALLQFVVLGSAVPGAFKRTPPPDR